MTLRRLLRACGFVEQIPPPPAPFKIESFPKGERFTESIPTEATKMWLEMPVGNDGYPILHIQTTDQTVISKLSDNEEDQS